ncbi:Protein ndrg3 [Homalodisca vitripennis]|nr:Protein ndrg3 [Homalodisca vitripennis]
MPSDSMDDIELRNIQLQFPAVRSLSRDDPSVEEVRVDTDRGTVLVAVQGNRSKPAILTYHDLGLNYVASFQAFFNYSDMRMLLENFSVYHVNAPGQEEGAHPLPDELHKNALDACTFDSKAVWECKNVLVELAKKNSCTSIHGKEKADTLAQNIGIGTESLMIGSEPGCGVTFSYSKALTKDWEKGIRFCNWNRA